MARYKSDIRAAVRDILRDEFVEGVTLEWEEDELDRLIAFTLREVEQKMPYEVKVTAEDELTQIKTQISATGTNLEVDSDDDFSTTYPFYITIEDEVLEITALASADNFTVGRAKLGTTAAVHAIDKSVGLTIVTTNNSKEIDLTNIGDLIRVRRYNGVEYLTGQNPKRFRNWTRFANTLTMVINILPSTGEAVHLYCLKKHTLTDASSTLNSTHEIVLIQGVTARAAINRGRELLNALNVGGVNVGPRMVKWGKDELDEYKKALKHHAIRDVEETLPRD